MSHQELWKEIFGDTDRYIDFYFKEKAARSSVYSRYEEGQLVSMAFFTPYEVVYRGVECICPCIVGVATSPAYRHRGYMKALLEQGIEEAAMRGCRAVYLCPADEKIYEPLGFRGVQYRTVIKVPEAGLERISQGHGFGHADRKYAVYPFCTLEADKKSEAAALAAKQLSISPIDFYRKRDVAYYEMVQKEMEALNGGVITVWDGGRMCGVASYIHEDDSYEVTEVVCDVRDGQGVFDAICRYIGRRERTSVIFSDGVFLAGVDGPGIIREKEERAYTMMRSLTGDDPGRELCVYINDIT